MDSRYGEETATPTAPGKVTRSAAVYGSTAPVQLKADDDEPGLAERVGQATVGALVSAITMGGAGVVLTTLGAVSPSVARAALEELHERAPDIVEAFVLTHPTTGLALLAIRLLSPQRVKAILEQLDDSAAARFIIAIHQAGLLVLFGPVLFQLDPSLTARILRNLGRDVLVPLVQLLPAAKTYFRSLFDQMWPVGAGFAVEGGVGATFGIPLYLGADLELILSRKSADTWELYRRGQAVEALDTGVGAGGFIGIGNKASGKGGGSASKGGGGLGVGAQIGASAQAGAKQIIIQKFDFPIFDDGAFVSLLVAATGLDSDNLFTIGKMMSSTIAGLDPMHYHKQTRFELKGFAEGNAAAEAGLRAGAPDSGATGIRATSNREGGAELGKRFEWYDPRNLLKAALRGQIALDAGLVVEVETAEMGADARGLPVPKKCKLHVSAEGQGAASLVHSIPFLSSLIPQLPSFDKGMGIKITWDVTEGGAGDPILGAHGYELYSMSGEHMDTPTQAQGGSEVSIGLGDITNPKTWQDWDAFSKQITGARIEKRIGLAAPFADRTLRRITRGKSFSTMVPATYRSALSEGIRLEGYLHARLELSGEQVRKICKTIWDLGGYIVGRPNALMMLYQEVSTFLTTGEAPQYIAAAFESIANEMLKSIRELRLHAHAGLAVAAGGQLSAGAKGRLHGHGSLLFTLDRDIVAEAGGHLTTADVIGLIRSSAETAGNVLGFTIKYGPAVAAGAVPIVGPVAAPALAVGAAVSSGRESARESARDDSRTSDD